MANTRIELSEQTKERLRDAYQILAGIPDDRFSRNLDCPYERKSPTEHADIYTEAITPDVAHDCDILACGAGWLALHPEFALRFDSQEFWLQWVRRTMLVGSDKGVAPDTLWDALFQPRSMSEPCYMSDKELLLYRFLRVLGYDPDDARDRAKEDTQANRNQRYANTDIRDVHDRGSVTVIGATGNKTSAGST